MAIDEETVRKDKQHIDEVNWRIRKIQEDTGDTNTARLVEMGEFYYSWSHPVMFRITAKAEYRYGDKEGRYWLDEYEEILRRAYRFWQEGAEGYKVLRERVEKLGLKLDINLKGADLYLTQDFIDSREAYRVDKTELNFNFSRLAHENFVDLLKYLEWKNETYCAAEGQKRRLDLARQIILFEAWEQVPAYLPENKIA